MSAVLHVSDVAAEYSQPRWTAKGGIFSALWCALSLQSRPENTISSTCLFSSRCYYRVYQHNVDHIWKVCNCRYQYNWRQWCWYRQKRVHTALSVAHGCFGKVWLGKMVKDITRHAKTKHEFTEIPFSAWQLLYEFETYLHEFKSWSCCLNDKRFEDANFTLSDGF